MAGEGWNDQLDQQLRRLWLALRPDGLHEFSSAEIGRRMRRSKNSIVGRAHRIELPARNPKRTLAEPAAAPSWRLPPKPHHPERNLGRPVAKRTLPAGEWAEPAPAVHVHKGGRPSAAKALEMPPAVQALPAQPAPTFNARCRFPLWKHGTRPSYGEHRFCDAPVVARADGCPSSWCAEHYATVFARAA